jgi:hypothetical protein
MRYAAVFVLVAGCDQVVDLPDQIVGYDDLVTRMCGCDTIRLQEDVSQAPRSLRERCSDTVETLFAAGDTEPLRLAVEAGCDRCEDVQHAQGCYALIAGAAALPDGAECDSALDCASFACGVSEVEFDLTPPLKIPKETAWRCVPSCVGCEDPGPSTDVYDICKGSLTALEVAGCEGLPGGVSKEELYALFVELSSCEAAEFVCDAQPSRPVMP